MSEPTLPDHGLLLKLRDGDHAAFERLYRLHSGAVYSRLRRMVRDIDAADELLQDLFVKVWEKRESIDPLQPFMAFLHTIARNIAVDYFRRLARLQRAESHLRLASSELDNATEEHLRSRETELVLRRALELLPPQRRRAFELCKIEGMTHQQAARAMNISANTVHNHLVKATATVRMYMQGAGQLPVLPVALLLVFG